MYRGGIVEKVSETATGGCCALKPLVPLLVYITVYIILHNLLLSLHRNLWKTVALTSNDDEMYLDDDSEAEEDTTDFSLDVHDINLNDDGNVKDTMHVSSGGTDGGNINSNFVKVIKDMVLVGHSSNQHAENVLLEIKGFKFAQNKEFSDCLCAVIPALMEIVAKDVTPSNDQVKLIQGVKSVCTASPSCWGYKLVNGLTQSDADKLAVIEYIEDYCIQPGCEMSFYAIFRFIMQLFYDAGMSMWCMIWFIL